MWRYFESVPEEVSSMRTQEAAAVADRHLRSIGYLARSMKAFPLGSRPLVKP